MFKDCRLVAAILSIAGNVLLVVLKLAGWRLSYSAGMCADALHSASDILISGLVFASILLTVRGMTAKEPEPDGDTAIDKDEGERTSGGSPFFAENLTALLISVLLILAAIGFVVAALSGEPVTLRLVPGAILIVWACIVLSYALARYKIRVGREEGSISLEADGRHSQMDMYSSIVVFIGLLGDLIGIRLDGIAAILVSFLVLKAGLEVLVSSIRGLAATEIFTYEGLGRLWDTRIGKWVSPWIRKMLGRHTERFGREAVRVGALLRRHRRVLAVLGSVLCLAAYVSTGLFCIQPDELGVVVRCGRLVEHPAEPGLHYRLPTPFSELHRVKPHAVRRVEFGFRTVARRGEVIEPAAYLWESMHRGGIYEKVEREAIMLTGDVNEVDLNTVVEYCIKGNSAAGFLFNLADSEALVRAATESVLRRVVGTKQLTEVLTTARPAIERELHAKLQALLDKYGACVTITAVRLQDVHPPVDVVSAFRRVATAREDRVTRINKAEAYRKWTIPRSRGLARTLIAKGEGHRIERQVHAEGDAAYFAQVSQAFREAPDVVAFNMYTERLQESLPPLRKFVFDKDIGTARGSGLDRLFMMGEFLGDALMPLELDGAAYPPAEDTEGTR